MKRNIKLADFPKRYKDNKKTVEAIFSRIMSKGIFIMGPEVTKFEKNFAKYVGASYAVAVNSGTDALALSLRACGIKTGDEVITVSFTATPTVNSICMTGATPVLVDVDPRTFNMDATKIEPAITKKTRAIIPVHLFGYPADMDAITRMAKKHGLIVIEDAAQAIGATYKSCTVGTIGAVGCFSFFPTKNLGAHGDAGAMVTNDATVADNVRSLRKYGERKTKFFSEEVGVNSRMDELQAALLNFYLKKIKGYNKKRAAIAKLYTRLLKDSPVVSPAQATKTIQPCWHQYAIQAPRRDELVEYLTARGIPTMVYYRYPVHTQKAYAFLKYTDYDLPVTAALSQKVVSLPIHPELDLEDAQYVADMVKKFYED